MFSLRVFFLLMRLLLLLSSLRKLNYYGGP